MIRKGQLIIDGVAMGGGLYIRNRNGKAVESRVYVSTGNGKCVSTMKCYMAVTKSPSVIVYTILHGMTDVVYDITGTAIPTGGEVHLTTGGEFTTPDALREGTFETLTSDAEDGSFCFEDYSGTLGDVIVWSETPMTDALDATSAGIKAQLSAHDVVNVENGLQIIPIRMVVKSESPCQYCGGTGNVSDGSVCEKCDGSGEGYLEYGGMVADITIQGAAPEGVEEVYLSSVGLTADNTRDYTLEGLTNNLRARGVVTSGRYTLTNECSYGTRCALWCKSESAGLTAALTINAINTCLSGDTPITMADGSTQRMDELSVGDSVLAGDGTSTKVVRVARGQFSQDHMLYTFEDGTVIDEVQPHRFFNCEQGFYQHLRRWCVGEHALRQDGMKVALVSSKRIDTPREAFGLWTETHDYYAAGLLSGETAANQRLIATATAEQAAEMAVSLAENAAAELLGLEGLLP